jgi:hypothetical protein
MTTTTTPAIVYSIEIRDGARVETVHSYSLDDIMHAMIAIVTDWRLQGFGVRLTEHVFEKLEQGYEGEPVVCGKITYTESEVI